MNFNRLSSITLYYQNVLDIQLEYAKCIVKFTKISMHLSRCTIDRTNISFLTYLKSNFKIAMFQMITRGNFCSFYQQKMTIYYCKLQDCLSHYVLRA
jgi:hypothetical protein